MAGPNVSEMNEIKVTIAGSYRKHFDRIVEAKQAFEALGATVLRPRSEQISSSDEDLVRLEGDPDDQRGIQDAQLQAINDSDLLYVVNPGGYVGASATLEVGYASGVTTQIVTSEPPFESAVALLSEVGDPAKALKLLENRNRGIE